MARRAVQAERVESAERTVQAAMDAYALTTIKFTNDEIFEPNPHGVKPLLIASSTVGLPGASLSAPEILVFSLCNVTARIA